MNLCRKRAVISKEVDGELLIYDLDRDKAHCLNPSAAAICDGRTTTDQIASSTSRSNDAVIGMGVFGIYDAATAV